MSRTAPLHAFRAAAHRCLARVAAHFGVDCALGRYGAVFGVACRGQRRRGVVDDAEGRLSFHFHGMGVDFRADALAIGFDVYIGGGRSDLFVNADRLAQFLASVGHDVDRAAAQAQLDEALAAGEIVERTGCAKSCVVPWSPRWDATA